MDEKTFLAFSLLVSLFGIAALFIVSEFAKSDETVIERLGMEKKTVVLEGRIVNIESTPSRTLITLSRESKENAVIFSSNLNLTVGDKVKITGNARVDDKDMIIDRIEKIK
jgi:hypothetical protein